MNGSRWAGRTAAGLACVAALAALPARPEAGAVRAAAPAAPELQLVDQTFVVPGVASPAGLSITVGGEALGDAPCATASDEIRLVARRAVSTRDQATASLEQPGPVVGTMSFALCSLARNANGTVTLTVPTTLDEPVVDTALRLPDAGVVPIEVQVRRAGDVDASFTTFVDRLATGADTTTPVGESMQVGLAVLVDGGPTLQPDGSTRVGDADRAAVSNLLTLLDAIGDLPITVGIRPELLEGLAGSPVANDAAQLADLHAALPGVDLLALPYVAVDPSAAANAGQTQLFDDQMRIGEDVWRDLMPELLPTRSLWLFDQPVSAAGAAALRAAGVRLGALLPPQAFSYSPPDRQFEIDYGSGGTLPATPVDGAIATALADPGADPTLTAYHLAAQVVLMRQMALDADQGRAPMRDHNMVLSTPTGRLGNLTTTTKLVQLLGATPGIALVDTSTITSRSILVDGRPYTEVPPDRDIASLGALGTELGVARATVDAVASMLPGQDPRPEAWRHALDVAASSVLTAEQRGAYFVTVQSGLDEVRAAIVPPPASKFTLGGRHSKIRLGLTNDGPVDLTVRVIISSEKLAIDDEDQRREVVVPANGTYELSVPVEARTNGEFPVDIKIVTPGNDDIAVTEPVRLTARVNALTGLGQLVTGAAVLVLLSWWVQHLRKRRRTAAAAATP